MSQFQPWGLLLGRLLLAYIFIMTAIDKMGGFAGSLKYMASKGVPMADPQCVRCSACVHVCPTGVLSFGQVDAQGAVVSLDSLLASPVQMRLRAPGPRSPAPSSPRRSA